MTGHENIQLSIGFFAPLTSSSIQYAYEYPCCPWVAFDNFFFWISSSYYLSSLSFRSFESNNLLVFYSPPQLQASHEVSFHSTPPLRTMGPRSLDIIFNQGHRHRLWFLRFLRVPGYLWPYTRTSVSCLFLSLGDRSQPWLLINRNYVDANTARSRGLAVAQSSNSFILRADSNNVLNPGGAGRDSVRVRSRNTYSHHVAVYVYSMWFGSRTKSNLKLDLISITCQKDAGSSFDLDCICVSQIQSGHGRLYGKPRNLSGPMAYVSQ